MRLYPLDSIVRDQLTPAQWRELDYVYKQEKIYGNHYKVPWRGTLRLRTVEAMIRRGIVILSGPFMLNTTARGRRLVAVGPPEHIELRGYYTWQDKRIRERSDQ